MKIVRSLFAVLSLPVLISACAHSGAANARPNDPTEGTFSNVSSLEPAPAPAKSPRADLAPAVVLNHNERSWSKSWTAAAQRQTVR